MKVEFKKEYYILFILNDAMIVQRAKFLTLFTLLVKIEWIKAFLVYMDIIYKEKNWNFFWMYL